MKVEKLIVTYVQDGAIVILEHANMEMKDVAHALIELAQPKLEITIPESQVEKFKWEAKQDYMKSTKLFTDYEAYQELYVRLKKAEFIRLEHAKQATNEVVMAYTKKLSDIKLRLNDLTEALGCSVNSDPDIINAVNDLFTPIED